MDPYKDENIGKRFGKRTVIKEVKTNKKGGKYYLFRCDCGNEKVDLLTRLMRGFNTRCPQCARADKKKEILRRKLHLLDTVDERSYQDLLREVKAIRNEPNNKT